MNSRTSLKVGVLALGLMLSGCKSAQDKANDAALTQAKQQAALTGIAQQVVWRDKDGNVVTMLVQPPAPGQTTQQVTTTKTTSSTTTTPAATTNVPAANGPVVGPADRSATGGSAFGPSGGPAYGNGQTGRRDGTYADPNRDGSYAGQNNLANNGNGYAPSGPQPMANGGPTVTPVDVHVSRGTTLPIRINQHISVKTSRPGDTFTGEVVRDVPAEGSDRIAIPHGTPVAGVIDAAHRRGHFKGRSILGLRLTSMTLHGQRYSVDTADNVRTKKGKGKRTAAFIGGGTGLGMLVGGVASGGVGMLVGGLAGAGAGTAVSGLTGNRDIEIPSESVINFRLADDLVVRPQ